MQIRTNCADEKGMVYLNCYSCKNISVQPVDQFLHSPQPQAISCKCGNAYDVQIEFRKLYRKKVRLEGFFSRLAPPGGFEKTTIIDISMNGCRLLIDYGCRLKKDDRIKLTFNLDNANHTKITKEAVASSLDDRTLGCKFLTTGSSFDSDLGFYLRSL